METNKRDWVDVSSKVLPPLLTAVLVALFGILGNSFLARQENARLVTEMQINRETYYEEVRLRIFDKAIDNLTKPRTQNGDVGETLSANLLNLELLAQNFGSAISLSPIFLELKRDLDKSKLSASELGDNKAESKEQLYKDLNKRLERLARDVTSKQIAVLEPQGKVVTVHIRFPEETSKVDCQLATKALANFSYTWLKSDYEKLKGDDDQYVKIVKEAWDIDRYGRSDQHYAFLTVSEINVCEKTVKVQAKIERSQGSKSNENPQSKSVFRQFSVNYFNFPMIDNTLVGNQQRFAVTLDDFNIDKKPNIVLKMIFFPSEYSKQSRPNLRETMKVLREATDAI